MTDNRGKNLYLCIYQYQGQETEGKLNSDKFMIVRADNKTEALYKYNFWLAARQNIILDETFEEYSERVNGFDGGWGYYSYKIDESQEGSRDDVEWFYKKYDTVNKR